LCEVGDYAVDVYAQFHPEVASRLLLSGIIIL
jgi:hypothetical protein